MSLFRRATTQSLVYSRSKNASEPLVRRVRMAWLARFALAGLAACSPWSAESKLREGGPTPYTRCLAAAPPAARGRRIGELEFGLRDRILTITSKHFPLRIAAFSGAGFGSPVRAPELAKLRQSDAQLLVMLGGLGETQAMAESNAKALAALNRPILLLLGGRDSWRVSQSALETLGESSSIINATALRRVVIANNTLIPVAGAERGRYALDEQSCGFAGKDLDAITKELGTPAAFERRWLISWQAAAGRGVLPSAARSETGVELGSVELGRFAQRVGVLGALCAWPAGRPELAASGPLTARLVPRLFGPRLERSDGSRAEPGILSLELDDQGLRVVQ